MYVIICYTEKRKLDFNERRGIMKKIILKWNIKKVKNTDRVTATYCFKSCSVNER